MIGLLSTLGSIKSKILEKTDFLKLIIEKYNFLSKIKGLSNY
jgi:hypothetical protein